jgi:hypothetical protein
MSVNKMMTNIKNIKYKMLPYLYIRCDKTDIEELSSDVYSILLFTLRESR